MSESKPISSAGPNARSILIERAGPPWKLIMQSGGGLFRTVGLPLAEFLSDQLGLSPEQLALADALVLDGMPVDDPKAAIVPDGARVALAAGLPGIAGLSMRSDSAVKVLRATITHLKQEQPDPRPGRVVLYLYSLVLPLLAAHFMSQGVLIKGDQFRRYARFAPDDLCQFGSQTLPASELAWKLEAFAAEEFVLTTHFTHDGKSGEAIKPVPGRSTSGQSALDEAISANSICDIKRMQTLACIDSHSEPEAGDG